MIIIYRAGTSMLGKDYFISPDMPISIVPGRNHGPLDFYINTLNWGVEILREGKDIRLFSSSLINSFDYMQNTVRGLKKEGYIVHLQTS